MPGDMILMNGHVMTGEADPRPATAVAVVGGRIVAVGTDAEARAWRRPGILEIDLHGRTLVPGFIDAHCHPMMVGFWMQTIDARTPPNRSIAALTARIAARARGTLRRRPGEGAPQSRAATTRPD